MLMKSIASKSNLGLVKKNTKNSELIFSEIMWWAAQIIAIVFLNPEIVVHLKQIILIPLEVILYLHMMK